MEKEIKIKKLSTIDIALEQYKILGNSLKKCNRISIEPEVFTKYCLIVCWCESNLDTTAISGDQQGIFQCTGKTRKLLGIGKDITKHTIYEQIAYHTIYFLNCDPKLLKAVKTPEDLHFLNFKPFGKRMVLATRKTNDLDFDDDGWITPADLKIFQLKRIKENKVIAKMYKEVTNDDTAK